MNNKLSIVVVLCAGMITILPLVMADINEPGNLTVSSNVTQTDASSTVSFSGQTGIGVSSPKGRLHVEDNGLSSGQPILNIIQDDASPVGLNLNNATYDSSSSNDDLGLRLYVDNNGNGFIIAPNKSGGTSGHFKIQTEGVVRFHIDNNTHATGIGTTDPKASLHVEDNGMGRSVVLNVQQDDQAPVGINVGNLTYDSSSNNEYTGLRLFVLDNGDAQIYAPDDASNPGDMQFLTDNTIRLVLDDTTGNVGIGTTSPDQLLDVSGSTALIIVQATGTGEHGFILKDTTQEWNLTSIDSNDNIRIRDVTSGVDSMTFKKGGNIYIGTNWLSNAGGNEGLQFNSDGTARFANGIAYTPALGDISMGSYTNGL